MSDRTLRHKVAIVGVGETQYFKHGQSPDPEFKLVLKAILAACASAGISPTRSTASPPTATIATMPCDSQPLWVFRNSVIQACNGVVGVAAVRRLPLPMPPPRLPVGLRIASSYFARWPKGSLFVTGRAAWRSATAVRRP